MENIALNTNTVDENALLGELLAELGGTGALPDEVLEDPIGHAPALAAVEPEVDEILEAAIEPEVEAAVAGETPIIEPDTSAVESHDDALLDEVAADAAIIDATQAAYAEAGTAAGPVSDADKPADESVEGVEKAKGKPRATVRQGPPLSKSQKVVAKLGEKASEFLLLEIADAELDEEALKAKQEKVLAEIDSLAKKVGEKATMLFGWLKNGGALNEVMRRTFEVLAKDGELTSGEKGNLQQNLLSKPYSKGTAASQANQMFMLLPALKVTVKERGKMVANPDSLILAKAKAELGL
jgi:hypothetical protein